MTRRFSISLPDDVAAELDKVENASAYIAEAIRRRRRAERVDEMLQHAGYQVTEEGVARMRERFRAQQERQRAYYARRDEEDGR